jgi:hypothetical protein
MNSRQPRREVGLRRLGALSPRRRTSVRLAAPVASGFKSRRRTCAHVTPPLGKDSRPPVREAVKGPLQTLAWNESERDSAVRVGESAEVGEARHRSPARGWRWDGGKRDGRDRGRPRRLRQGATLPDPGTREARATERSGAVEGSERLIVVLTPAERREERRGRSQEGRAREQWTSDRRRTE